MYWITGLIGLALLIGGIIFICWRLDNGIFHRWYVVPVVLGAALFMWSAVVGIPADDYPTLEERIEECRQKGGAYYDEENYSCIIDVDEYLSID